jgi:hypothetical protein
MIAIFVCPAPDFAETHLDPHTGPNHWGELSDQHTGDERLSVLLEVEKL